MEDESRLDAGFRADLCQKPAGRSGGYELALQWLGEVPQLASRRSASGTGGEKAEGAALRSGIRVGTEGREIAADGAGRWIDRCQWTRAAADDRGVPAE